MEIETVGPVTGRNTLNICNRLELSFPGKKKKAPRNGKLKNITVSAKVEKEYIDRVKKKAKSNRLIQKAYRRVITSPICSATLV